MPYVHKGTCSLTCTFREVWEYLEEQGEQSGETTKNRSPFIAYASIAERRGSEPERVIRFVNPEKDSYESARSYECCWGSQSNCIRQRIGMYCEALERLR